MRRLIFHWLMYATTAAASPSHLPRRAEWEPLPVDGFHCRPPYRLAGRHCTSRETWVELCVYLAPAVIPDDDMDHEGQQFIHGEVIDPDPSDIQHHHHVCAEGTFCVPMEAEPAMNRPFPSVRCFTAVYGTYWLDMMRWRRHDDPDNDGEGGAGEGDVADELTDPLNNRAGSKRGRASGATSGAGKRRWTGGTQVSSGKTFTHTVQSHVNIEDAQVWGLLLGQCCSFS